MTIHTDDTELDALAAQVRAFTPLGMEEVTALLVSARATPGGPAAERLIEDHLGLALDAALARRDRGVEVMDLYQEGSIAATVAVAEFAGRGGAADGLRHYVARVVESFLDGALERERAQQEADRALLEQVQLLETAEVALRRRLQRQPTPVELAAVLEWTPEQLELVAGVLSQARTTYDSEIVDFLDDL